MGSLRGSVRRISGMLCMSLFLMGSKAWCASAERADSLTCTIRFRLGSSTIDTRYKDNSVAIATFRAALDSVGIRNIGRISIRSWASPDGGTPLNDRLSAERASATRRMVRELLTDMEVHIDVESEGESWDGLKSLVAKDRKLDAGTKRHVMTILDGTHGTERKKLELKRLPCYRYLTATYYTELRNSVVCAFYVQKDTVSPMVKQPADTVTIVNLPVAVKDTAAVTADTSDKKNQEYTYPVEVSSGKRKDGLMLAVKTNLLYDALLVPNVGVELPLSTDWSVSADWMYAWWKSDSRHNYWRIYGGELEARRWFGKTGRRKLTGHHVGVYGQMLTYDFERGGRGYLGDRWSYAAGLSYGYSMPIAKRLNLDLCVGVGYLGGKYKEYVPADECYVWQSSKERHYIGPTKAEISLVWLLGRGYDTTKGGQR